MKNVHFCFILLLAVIAISSCVSSLYPISDNENDFIFREEFLGNWVNSDMQTQVILNKADDKRYKITTIDKKYKEVGGNKIPYSDTSHFSGFLIQFDGHYFFDCTADMDNPQFNCLGEESRSSTLQLHFIYKVQLIGKDRLSVAGIDMDALQKFIANNRGKIKYEQLNKDKLLLTADAAHLQKNILINKEAASVFSKPDTLSRNK